MSARLDTMSNDRKAYNDEKIKSDQESGFMIFIYSTICLSVAELVIGGNIIHSLTSTDHGATSVVHYLFELLLARILCTGFVYLTKTSLFSPLMPNARSLVGIFLCTAVFFLSMLTVFLHMQNFMFLTSLEACVDSSLSNATGGKIHFFAAYMCEVEYIKDFSCSCVTSMTDCYSYPSISHETCSSLMTTIPVGTLWSLMFSVTCTVSSLLLLVSTTVTYVLLGNPTASKNAGKSMRWHFLAGVILLLSSLAAYWEKKSTSKFLPAPNQRKLQYFDGVHHNSGENTSKQHLENLLEDHDHASDMMDHPFESIHENVEYNELHKVRDILFFCIGLTMTICLIGVIYRKIVAKSHQVKAKFHSPGSKIDPTSNDSKYENTIEIMRLNQRGKAMTEGIYDKESKEASTMDTLDHIHTSDRDTLRPSAYYEGKKSAPMARSSRITRSSTQGQSHLNGMVRVGGKGFRSISGSSSASTSSANSDQGFSIEMMMNSSSTDQHIDRVDTIEEISRSNSLVKGQLGLGGVPRRNPIRHNTSVLQPEFSKDERHVDEPWLRDQSPTSPAMHASKDGTHDGYSPMLKQDARSSWFADMSK